VPESQPPAPVPDYLSLLGLGVDGVRIGIDESVLSQRVAAEIGDAVTTAARVLEERGARRISISVPALEPIVDCFMESTPEVGGVLCGKFFLLPVLESWIPVLKGCLKIVIERLNSDLQ
jgi:hypothetical protein